MSPKVLSELRILSNADFDATSLLTVVLSGDGRLLELLRHEDLIPLGTRIRTRLRPRLLLLDPLVRLHGVDENHTTEMAALLAYFRTLQRQLDLSVVLVHHTRKNAAGEQVPPCNCRLHEVQE